MSLSLKICRFDPEVDREPYFQEFRVEIAGHQTVLDVLLEAWRQDPGLSFRRSCRSAICGSCAVTINGTPSRLSDPDPGDCREQWANYHSAFGLFQTVEGPGC